MSLFDRLSDWWYKRVWIVCKFCGGRGRVRIGGTGRISTMVRVCLACKGLGKVIDVPAK
jgi:DnaJ-class molecular chaperone